LFFFFFNDTATTEIYTLSLHDALPISQTGPNGAARMALQVWGEALQNPRLRDLVAGVYQTIRARFVQLARQAQNEGQLPPDADPEEAGLVLFGLVPGFILQLVLVGGITRSQYLRGIDALLGGVPHR